MCQHGCAVDPRAVGYGDPRYPERPTFKSITGVAFLKSLCSLRDDPGSYATVSRNSDSLHCLVKNCGLRWNESAQRWLGATEELLTQGFAVGPVTKDRMNDGHVGGYTVSSCFNLRRDGRNPLAVKHAAGNTVHPQSSGMCAFWIVQHVLVPNMDSDICTSGIEKDVSQDKVADAMDMIDNVDSAGNAADVPHVPVAHDVSGPPLVAGAAVLSAQGLPTLPTPTAQSNRPSPQSILDTVMGITTRSCDTLHGSGK